MACRSEIFQVLVEQKTLKKDVFFVVLRVLNGKKYIEYCQPYP